MLLLLTQNKHFLQFTPFWYRVSAEILNYLFEILRKGQHRWKFKPFSISGVSFIPCTTDYEIQTTGFDLQIQSSLPVSKLSDNSSKKKNRRRKYQLLLVEKNLKERNCLYCTKGIHTSSTPQQSTFENQTNWDTLWKQNGWTEKYFRAQK